MDWETNNRILYGEFIRSQQRICVLMRIEIYLFGYYDGIESETLIRW